MAHKITGYELTRQWFDMVWERTDITSNDTALYLWLCEIWNRIGHPESFQITAKECMQGMSANSYNTFKKSFDKLKEMGCYNLIKQSSNQYQCNVIALLKFDKAPAKALNKAPIKARTKASETFIKQVNPEPLNPEPIKDKTYADCIGLYNNFCLEKLNVPAKIDGAQGNALKSIIIYLGGIEKIKNGTHSVTETFKLVLDNWGKWDKFYQSKLKLTEINSNFINILNNIKSPQTNGRTSEIFNNPQELADALKAGREEYRKRRGLP